MSNAENIRLIRECEKEMSITYDELAQAISNCKESKSRLIKEDFLDYVDDFFLPDNRSCRKKFEMSIQELIGLLEQSRTLANVNQRNLGCINEFLRRARRFFPMLIMHHSISSRITMPALFEKSSLPPVVLTVVGITITATLCIHGILFGVAAIFAFAILMLTAVMVQVGSRKKCFIEGTKTYSQKKKEICREVYEPLNQISKQSKSWLDCASEQCSAKQYSLDAQDEN